MVLCFQWQPLLTSSDTNKVKMRDRVDGFAVVVCGPSGNKLKEKALQTLQLLSKDGSVE